jgi:hypothetical protein
MDANIIRIIDSFAAADTPYREDHNGVIGVAKLRSWGDGHVVIYDNNRAFDVSGYKVSASHDSIKFYSDDFDSYFELSPLTLETPQEVWPGSVRTYPTLDHVEEMAVTAIKNADSYTPNTPDPEVVDFTLDDKGNVLELLKTTDDGDMFYWENGDWQPVTKDGDYPTIYDRPLLEVERDDIGLAIQFWTKAQESGQHVTKDDVTRFAKLYQ